MPAGRKGIDRETKVGAILDAAEAALRQGGFDAMSVAGLARQLGIAQNSIYWYFGSKDELFVAALRRLLEDIVRTKPAGDGELAKIIWTVDRMTELTMLRNDLRARAAISDTAADLQRELDGWLDTLLTAGLRASTAADATVAAHAMRATAEGVVALGLPNEARQQVLAMVYNRLARS